MFPGVAMPDLPAPRAVAAKPDTLTPRFMVAVIASVVVAGLYFGRPVLLPLALAVLMSFALAPLVGLLKRLKLGNVLPVLVSLLFAVVIMSSLAAFMGAQLANLAADLPRYQTNLSQKIHSVVGPAFHNDTVTRLNRTINNLADQITGGTRPEESANTEPNQIKPIPVEIKRTSMAPWSVAQNVLGPLVEPLGLIVLVLVFVGFILLQKDDLRDRFVRLAIYRVSLCSVCLRQLGQNFLSSSRSGSLRRFFLVM